MCGSCGASLQPPNTTCQVCGTAAWPTPPPPQAPPPPNYGQPTFAQPVPVAPGFGYGVPMRVVTPKSSGIAVLLSILWLGAGNLYVNQTGLGIGLLLANFPLWLLAVTVLGWFIAFPLWIIGVVVSTVLAAQGAKEYNMRNGIVVY
ncbi:hypothetical protein [Saccharothrix violaceirubra]|uniref:TM2 domain-containing membrane protein YozV n=2 Tax=Saccharothrix violaceirubra TaxID=413306 RepID=A0A7W7WTU6_9PSEU|nr:hypothetical protein [Saccharothrix violaceirubra]MBB4963092.1 TM2 domain-containing membrane protein YozV [Saccharothrix violaceirubra]